MKYRYKNDPRFIKAKFDSTCAETKLPILKGEDSLYHPGTRKVYHSNSKTFKEWQSQKQADNLGLLDAGW